MLGQIATMARYQKCYNLLSLSAESCECVVNEFTCLDEVSAKFLYADILSAVKELISDEKIDYLMNLSQVLEEISKIKSDECLKNYQNIHGIGNFNLITLACKNKAIKVLEYIFSEQSQTLYNLSIQIPGNKKESLLSVKDEFCHNAFYYAMRSNVTDLLSLLVNKWQGQYSDEVLDDLLSQSYKELKLRNISLMREMQLFVQSKILDLRFFHTSTTENSGTGNSWDQIKKRIELVVKYVRTIKTEYWDQDPDEKFIFISEFIAKSIHILKSLLKSTYDKLPWEEIEFCLIIFIRCCKNPSDPNVVYNCVLNKKQLLMHLFNFSIVLDTQHHKFENNNIMRLAKSVKMPRDIVIDKITKMNSEFCQLYDDYEKVRDFCSLEIIESYADLIESSDATEEQTHLLFSRVLQVMGEHLKNTLDTPKLSTKTANTLLSSLSFNTINIITKLRDSLSHEESLYIRSKIERKVHLFKNLPTDILKIKAEITNMIYIIRIASVENLIKKIRLCDTFEGLKELYGPYHSSADLHDKELHRAFCNSSVKGDFKRLEELISLLDKELNDKTILEKSLFDQIHYLIQKEIQKEKEKFENLVHENRHCTAFHHIFHSSIQMYTRTNILNVIQNMVGISEITTSEPSSNPLRNFEHIEILLHELLGSAESRLASSRNLKLYYIISSISNFKEIEMGKVKWIEEFRDIINENTISIKHILPEKLLASKLSVLKETLMKCDLKDGCSSADFSSFVSNKKFRALMEMLVLDILCLLESSFSRNPFFLDSDYPLLTGRNLRNHLAHGNVLINICLEDSFAQLLENAKKILTELMARNDKKMDRVIKFDCLKLESCIDYGLRVIINQRRLFTALEEGNMKDVAGCLHEGADIYGKDGNASTCLHFAGKAQESSALNWVLAQGLDVSSKDNAGQTVLHIAAKFNRKEVIRYLVEQRHMSLDLSDINGKTPLHVAVQNHSNNVVEYISKLEINTTIKDKSGKTAFHIAICRNNIDAAKILLEKERNIDDNKLPGNLTALHIATHIENLNLVGFLVAKKADVNSKSDYGDTPLHIASSLGNFEIAEYLVLKYADVNARNEAGATPLYEAIGWGGKEMVEFLLKHKVDVNASDDNQYTPLMMAAFKGNASIAELLVRKGAFVDSKDNFGYTPLHVAATRGHCEIIELLLNHNAIVDCKNNEKQTALHLSAIYGHKEVVKLLLKEGADINAIESTTSTPLHLAASAGHRDIVYILIDEGADTNCKDESESTALHHAARNADRGMVESLLKKGADIRASDANKVTPLDLLICRGLSDLLTSEGRNVKNSDAKGFTLLHIAALFGDQLLVEYCIDKNCDINARSNSGLTALHLAAQRHHPKTVTFLLSKGAEIEAKDEYDNTPLFLAVKSECRDTVKILVSHEMYDMNSRNNDTYKALVYSVCFSKSDVACILLENYKFDIDNEFKQMLLNKAVDRNQKHVLTTLLDRGFEVNGVTELLITAVQKKHYEMVEFLLSKGANPMLSDEDNVTPFHSAAILGDVEMVEILLSQKANIRIESKVIISAAGIAIYTNHLDIIKYLIQMKVIDADARRENGFTLLHSSTFYGLLDIARYLVAEGADINAKDEKERKPVHIAAEKGFRDLVEFYLNCKDLEIETAELLLLAAIKGKANICKLLFERDPYVNKIPSSDVNPIHFALLEGHKDVLCILLHYGAYYNAHLQTHLLKNKNNGAATLLRKVKKLFAAVQKNAASEVETLLKEQSSSEYCLANAKCVRKETVLHYASWKGYEEVVNILLKYNTNTIARSYTGETPLHYAVKFSKLSIVKALLSNGAIYNALSQTGKTPLDYATHQEIRDFLLFVNNVFTKVLCKDISVLEDLREKDEGVMRAVIRAQNQNGKTLIEVAYMCDFPETDELQILFETDINNDIKSAEKFFDEERYTEAFLTYECVLKKRFAIFGADSHPVLDVKFTLANLYEIQQNFDKALKLFQEVHYMRKNSLGEGHTKTLFTETSIAFVLLQRGERQEALNIFKAIDVRQKETFQLDDLNVLYNKLGISTALYEMNRFGEALKIIIEVEEICSQKKDELWDISRNIRFSKAMIFKSQGKYPEALELFKNEYESRKNNLTSHHSETLKALSGIADVFNLQEKFDESLEVYRKVLDIQRSHLPADHSDILQSELRIGNVLFIQEIFVTALKMFLYLERRIAAIGTDSALMKEIKDRIEFLKDFFSRFGWQCVFERIKNHNRQTKINPFEVAVQMLESIGEKPIVQSENPITV